MRPYWICLLACIAACGKELEKYSLSNVHWLSHKSNFPSNLTKVSDCITVNVKKERQKDNFTRNVNSETTNLWGFPALCSRTCAITPVSVMLVSTMTDGATKNSSIRSWAPVAFVSFCSSVSISQHFSLSQHVCSESILHDSLGWWIKSRFWAFLLSVRVLVRFCYLRVSSNVPCEVNKKGTESIFKCIMEGG